MSSEKTKAAEAAVHLGSRISAPAAAKQDEKYRAGVDKARSDEAKRYADDLSKASGSGDSPKGAKGAAKRDDGPRVSVESSASGPRKISYGGIDYVVPPGKSAVPLAAGHSAKAVAAAIVAQLGAAVVKVKLERDTPETEDEHLVEHVEKMQGHAYQPIRKPTDSEKYTEEELKAAQVQWAKEEMPRLSPAEGAARRIAEDKKAGKR